MKFARLKYAAAWLFGSTLVLAVAHAQQPMPRYCQIEIEFSLEGKPIAAPVVVVEFGTEAEISIDKPDGSGQWQFRILANAPTMNHRVTAIPIDLALYEISNGHSTLRASPHLAVAPGQRADLDTIFGEDQTGDVDGRKAHIALVASLRADGNVDGVSPDADASDAKPAGEPR